MHCRVVVAQVFSCGLQLWAGAGAAVAQGQGQDLSRGPEWSVAQAVAETTLGILSFARWPDDPQEIALCVVGPVEHAQVLLQAGGAGPATGHRVAIRVLAAEQPLAGCDALYLGKLSQARLQGVLLDIAGHAVLTISESREACLQGGMFCLEVGTSEAGFEVNLDSVARSGVRVQPRVLQLGRHRQAGGAAP